MQLLVRANSQFSIQIATKTLNYFIHNLPEPAKKKANRWQSLEDQSKSRSEPLKKINLEYKIIMQLQSSKYGESYLIDITAEENETEGT